MKLTSGKWPLNPQLPHRVGQHGAEVGGQSQHSQAVEQHPVDHSVPEAPGGQQHDEGDHKVSKEDQEPGDEGTHHAAAVLDEPHLICVTVWTLHHLLPIQQGALLLHISQPVAGGHSALMEGNREKSLTDTDLSKIKDIYNILFSAANNTQRLSHHR